MFSSSVSVRIIIIINPEERREMTTTKMETTEEETNNKSSFSRVKELHAMFEESLTSCFEVKTIGVRLIILYFVVFSRV